MEEGFDLAVRVGNLPDSSERVLATEIHAVWPQTRYLPSKTRAAIDALVAEISAMVGYPGED